MKKIICLVLTVMLVAAMAVPAFAVTPDWEYHAPEIPEVTLSEDIQDSISNAVSNYFTNFTFNFSAITLG